MTPSLFRAQVQARLDRTLAGHTITRIVVCEAPGLTGVQEVVIVDEETGARFPLFASARFHQGHAIIALDRPANDSSPLVEMTLQTAVERALVLLLTLRKWSRAGTQGDLTPDGLQKIVRAHTTALFALA